MKFVPGELYIIDPAINTISLKKLYFNKFEDKEYRYGYGSKTILFFIEEDCYFYRWLIKDKILYYDKRNMFYFSKYVRPLKNFINERKI